jgi:methyl-accepting chemotaxis protein
VGKATQLIDEVSAASGEQAQGIEQVNTAVAQMDKVTQSNAANAEESASASEELSAQADELTEMVGVLVKIVGGAGSADGGSSAKACGAGSPMRSATPSRASAPRTDTRGGASQERDSNLPAAAPASSRTAPVDPETVIPMDEGEFKEF